VKLKDALYFSSILLLAPLLAGCGKYNSTGYNPAPTVFLDDDRIIFVRGLDWRASSVLSEASDRVSGRGVLAHMLAH